MACTISIPARMEAFRGTENAKAFTNIQSSRERTLYATNATSVTYPSGHSAYSDSSTPLIPRPRFRRSKTITQPSILKRPPSTASPRLNTLVCTTPSALPTPLEIYNKKAKSGKTYPHREQKGSSLMPQEEIRHGSGDTSNLVHSSGLSEPKSANSSPDQVDSTSNSPSVKIKTAVTDGYVKGVPSDDESGSRPKSSSSMASPATGGDMRNTSAPPMVSTSVVPQEVVIDCGKLFLESRSLHSYGMGWLKSHGIGWPTRFNTKLTFKLLMDIAMVAHRNEGNYFKSWTMRVIRELFMASKRQSLDGDHRTPQSPSPSSSQFQYSLQHPSYIRTATIEEYTYLLEVLILYDQQDLRVELENRWISRLLWREFSSATSIIISERLDQTRLLSYAYYVHLVDSVGTQIWRPPQQDPSLDRRQYQHLLSGYHSLRTYGRTLTGTSLELAKGEGCPCHGVCVVNWNAVYLGMMVRWMRTSMNVLVGLMQVQEFLGKDRSDKKLQMVWPACRQGGLRLLAKKREEIARALHHHYCLQCLARIMWQD